MIIPVSSLSIKQHSSTDFPQDFSVICIRHLFCSLRPYTRLDPYPKTDRLVFYLVLYLFAYVSVLTSLLSVGSSIHCWSVLSSSSYLPVHPYIWWFMFLGGQMHIQLQSYRFLSTFPSNICVTAVLYRYLCFIYNEMSAFLLGRSFQLSVSLLKWRYMNSYCK
jgi:hypothetical protein